MYCTDIAKSTAGAQASVNPETENQIFCFQFPPILPRLIDSKTERNKLEPKDPEEVDVKPDVKTQSCSFAARKLAAQNKALLKARLAELTTPPPAGLVGKLRVHRSGRVTTLWGTGDDENGEGAVEMEVNRGTYCGFLQELVVMKEESPYGEEDVDDKKKRRGIAYSLGQIKGKYVVSPDFGELIKASGKKPQHQKEEKKEAKEEPMRPLKVKKGTKSPNIKRAKEKGAEKRVEIVLDA